MERERIVHEKEEEEKRVREQKIKEEFGDANNQWEKDKADMQNLAASQPRRDAVGGESSQSNQGAAAKVAAPAAGDSKTEKPAA